MPELATRRQGARLYLQRIVSDIIERRMKKMKRLLNTLFVTTDGAYSTREERLCASGSMAKQSLAFHCIP